MREACIILPNELNANTEFKARGPDVQKQLALELCTRFGGCTVIDSHGMWLDGQGNLYDEPGKMFVVAGNDTDSNNEAIKHVAHDFGRMMDQLAIYYRDFTGQVHIDDLPHHATIEQVAAA